MKSTASAANRRPSRLSTDRQQFENRMETFSSRRTTTTRPSAVNPLSPPQGLSAREADLWSSEFGALPSGHMQPSDIPHMRRHLRLLVEERDAFENMVRMKRSRDAAAHWRSCVSLLGASSRSLRIQPHQRLPPRRVGLLQAGSEKIEEIARGHGPSGASDWRALFPAAHKPGRSQP